MRKLGQSDLRGMGMEKYRGKNEPIGMSSKRDSFRGQERGKFRWIDVSAKLVNGSFKFSLVLVLATSQKNKVE